MRGRDYSRRGQNSGDSKVRNALAMLASSRDKYRLGV